MFRRLLAAIALLAGLTAVAVSAPPVLARLAQLMLAAALILLCLWGLWSFYRRALWKVGRRLAFSYFLVGIVPIPLALLLLAAIGYLLCGLLVGHAYLDAVAEARSRLATEAAVELARFSAAGAAPRSDPDEAISVAAYRAGRRVAGDPDLPAEWPNWVHDDAAGWFLGPSGVPTLAAGARDGSAAVLAVWTGELAVALSEKSGIWVDHLLPSEEADRGLQVQIGQTQLTFQSPSKKRAEEAAAFFATRRPGRGGGTEEEEEAPVDADEADIGEAPDAAVEVADEASTAAGDDPGDVDDGPGLFDRPLVWWGQIPGPLIDLAAGGEVAPVFFVTLNGTLRGVAAPFRSERADVDVQIFAFLFALGFLLFDAYVVAAVVAGVLIFTLSRAVNRLSTATESVRGGDFSVRIPVKRKDQVGELQRSFNRMAERLEQLVTTAAEKEVLEKELEIARELQRSLLPRDLPGGEAVEFSTLFAPSAAIGGDYFDILELADGRLAVVVADVSGHGLPSGLRMAMVKAALTILVEEEKDAEGILRRLDRMVRADDQRRLFVTATLALVDLEAGSVEITNAGHPPTYLLRGGEVEEIVLPGSPLGGLGRDYGQRRIDLVTGDVLVWLSDGLIEATDHQARPFGYPGVKTAIGAAGAVESPAAATTVRDGLVSAVERHTGGRPVEDDLTVVVMCYQPVEASERLDPPSAAVAS